MTNPFKRLQDAKGKGGVNYINKNTKDIQLIGFERDLEPVVLGHNIYIASVGYDNERTGYGDCYNRRGRYDIHVVPEVEGFSDVIPNEVRYKNPRKFATRAEQDTVLAVYHNKAMATVSNKHPWASRVFTKEELEAGITPQQLFEGATYDLLADLAALQKEIGFEKVFRVLICPLSKDLTQWRACVQGQNCKEDVSFQDYDD